MLDISALPLMGISRRLSLRKFYLRPLAKIRNLAPDRGKGEGKKGKGTFMSAFFLFPTSARSLMTEER
jgi:hypothetical protein